MCTPVVAIHCQWLFDGKPVYAPSQIVKVAHRGCIAWRRDERRHLQQTPHSCRHRNTIEGCAIVHTSTTKLTVSFALTIPFTQTTPVSPVESCTGAIETQLSSARNAALLPAS
jgi:hypothetical protein